MIYGLIAGFVVLASAFIALIVIFFRAKKNFEEEKHLWVADLNRMNFHLEASKKETEKLSETLNEAVLVERKNAEEFLERAVSFEEKFNELGRSYGRAVVEKDTLEKELEAWKMEASKQLSHRKSSEVRTGSLTEHIAPLLDDFPYDFKTAKFMGQPIDYICYCEDGANEGVHFVEVKSGDSQLSSKQRKLKQLIEDGKVSFEVYRLKK